MSRRGGWRRLGRKRFRDVDFKGRAIDTTPTSSSAFAEMVYLTARMLNEYIGEQLGNGFTAKDFRTWGGTLLAAAELAKQAGR